MNLYSLLRSEGVDLDALPFESAETAPRQQFQFTTPYEGQRLRAPADFDKVFQDAGDAYGVDPYILKSIAFAESRFNPDIISGKVKSPAGAIGLMQFMPDTAKEYDIDPTNPVEAIFGAAAYMRQSLDKFDGDYGKAVASYNAGRNRKSFDSEDWDLRLPAETQKYMQTVFSAVTGFKDGGAERGLPEGVTPSKAGGGRGSVSPGMVNTKDTQFQAPPEDTLDAKLKKQGEFSPVDEASKGVQTGWTGLKQMWESNKVLKDAVLADSMAQRLSAFDRIDAGAKDVPRAIGLAYQNATPEGRAKIRADVMSELANRKEFIGASMATIRQYQADMQRTQGRTPDFTDIETVKDFGNWLTFNGASGLVSMAPLMVAAVITGPAAPLVAGAMGLGMATGELNADRIKFAQDKLSASRFSRNPDRYDDAVRAENQRVTDYVADKSGSTVAAAVPFAALDVVAGPVGSLLKGSTQEAAKKGAAYVAKELSKDTGEEALTGGLQEVIKIGTEGLIGEQQGNLLTGENLKRVINSAAAEGAGGLTGGGARLAYQAVTQAPRVENQPTTPQAPQVNTPAADPTKAQAVDDIAAAILEAEGNAPSATQATPVQPGSQAADTGTAPVAQGEEDTTGGLAATGAVDVAGQSESAQSLTQPSNFSATPTATVGTQTTANAGPGFTAQGLSAEMAALKARRAAPQSPAQSPTPQGIGAELAAIKNKAQPKPEPLLNDDEEAMLADFERLYQEDVKGDIRQRLGIVTPEQAAAEKKALKAKKAGLTPFKQFLRDVGIKSSLAADIVGTNAMEGNRKLPGAFRKNGMNLDLMVSQAIEQGFMLPNDAESGTDNGGVNQLVKLIQQEFGGNPVQRIEAQAENMEQKAADMERSTLDDKAAALGFGRAALDMPTDKLANVIGRIERRLGRPVRQDFETRKMLRSELREEQEAVLMATRIERARIKYDAEIQAFAEANGAVQDAVLDVVADADGNVEIVYPRAVAAAEAADQLNGQWSDQNAEVDTSRAGAGQEDSGQARAPVTSRQGQGAGNPEADRTEAGAGSQEGLTTYTPEEVTARQDAAAQAEAATKRAEAAADKAEAAAKQANEIAQRSVAAADTFELGQSAEDNLSGQAGLKFSRAAAPKPFADIARHFQQYPSTPPSGMSMDEARAFMRGRRDSMEALVDAYAGSAEGLMLPVRGNGGFWGVTREVRPDGSEWRVTRFDQNMEPQGHEAHNSARDAVADVLQWVDPARLDQGLKFSKKAKVDAEANLATWGRNAPKVTSGEADTYAFKTGEAVLLEAFHGTGRGDRVGTKFLKKRATSGPMSFFTSSPVLASGYATGKADTSLADEDNDFANWFKYKPVGSRSTVPIDRAWYFLDAETKSRIAERMPDIRTDDDVNIIYEEGGGDIGSYEWNLKQTQRSFDRGGNPLAAAVETWLTSGALFNSEQDFMQVLKLAGFPVKDITYDNPSETFPFVYKTWIRMSKPLVTSQVPQSVVDALKDAAARDRSKAKYQRGADLWDKNTRTLREWVNEYLNPPRGDNKYVWTSIPDKVTEVFQSLGYDGIIDWSGKGGGTSFPVYIPFEQNQIKSAIGNNGKFSEVDDILKSVGKRESLDDITRSLDDAGVSNSIFERDGVITVSKIVVPKDRRNSGIGTDAMQRIVAYADRTGQHIALTPSADFGGNKSRLTEFYKRFGFKENKGRNRVFSVSESMVRENSNGKTLYSQGTQTPRTPISTITQAITKAYGNALTRLQGKGLVTLTQTEDEALKAAAAERAKVNGTSEAVELKSLRASVNASQRAWHGTPHRGIEKFSTDKIGTGEGAQAFGWGLYFADIRDVAELYRRKLTTPDGNQAETTDDSIQIKIGRLQEQIDQLRKDDSPSAASMIRAYEKRIAELDAAGQLYEVEIPDDTDMLLWDKLLSQQDDTSDKWSRSKWRDIADEEGLPYQYTKAKGFAERTGEDFYKALSQKLGSDKAASLILNSYGIKGIKYLDGQSRDRGEGGYNYVVFDGADVRIIDVKYSADGNLQGFHDPATGKSFLIADNLTAETAPGVFMHEVGIHMAVSKDGKGRLDKLFNRAKVMVTRQTGSPFLKRVADRMAAAGETSGEEAAAYIVEQYENDKQSAPNVVHQWVKDFIADVRAWLFNRGVLLKADQLTVADIAAVARANVRGMASAERVAESAERGAEPDPEQGDIRRSVAPRQQSTPQTQPRSLWRDETNRLQFAPGAWLWEKLGEKAGPLLSMAGLKTASPELRAQLRRMKLDVQKAQETAAKVATSTAKFSEEERAMVSDLVEKTVKAGTVPPEHAIKLAGLIDQVMGKQTDELIELGMLSKDTAERWRGQYLPRYYETKMRGKDAWTAAMDGMMRRARLMKGIGGKHLKGRGLFETVPVEKQADYEALGWEVRDPDFDATKDKTVQMWRDFTPEERAEMGEIRDAGFRFVMGYMQTQKDIALGRMFRSIANDDNLSSRTQTGEFTVKVPDTKVEGTGAFVYGALAGRYVSRETLSVLSSQSEAQNDLLVAYRKALGLWKEGKTVLNPVSHVNNMVSNVTMAHLAGVSYHRGDKYLMAVRDFAKGDKMVKEAKDAGLFLGGFNESELFNSMPAELKELAQKAESRVESGVNTAMNVMTLWLRKPMQNAYGFEDDFFKYLIYKDARSRGATPDAAVDYAQRYIFTYDDLPKTARIIRDSALPFFAYTYKAIPALLHTALTHPVRIATPAALLYGATMMAYAIAASEADEPWDEIVKRYLSDGSFRDKVGKAQEDAQKNLPPWQRGYTAFMTPKSMLVGHDKVLDLPVYMDISRFIPGGDIFDVAPNAGGVPLPAPITPSHPVLSIGVAMIGNRDLFTGKDIVDKNDTTGEAAGKRADWMWKQISPAITIGNYHYERGMNMVAQASGQPITIFRDYTGRDRMGMPVTADYGIPQTFGIKLRPVDMALSQQIQGGQDNAMVRQIMAEVSQLQRLAAKGAVTQEAVNKEMQKANEKIANIRKGLTVDGDERK